MFRRQVIEEYFRTVIEAGRTVGGAIYRLISDHKDIIDKHYGEYSYWGPPRSPFDAFAIDLVFLSRNTHKLMKIDSAEYAFHGHTTVFIDSVILLLYRTTNNHYHEIPSYYVSKMEHTLTYGYDSDALEELDEIFEMERLIEDPDYRYAPLFRLHIFEILSKFQFPNVKHVINMLLKLYRTFVHIVFELEDGNPDFIGSILDALKEAIIYTDPTLYKLFYDGLDNE